MGKCTPNKETVLESKLGIPNPRCMCTHLLYLSSEAVTSPSAAGLSPCQAPSSAAVVHYAARRYAAACTPSPFSVQSIHRKIIWRENRERG